MRPCLRYNLSLMPSALNAKSLAERQGFEPWIEFPLYTLSKRAPSTTRPSLHLGKTAGPLKNNTQCDPVRVNTITIVPHPPITRRAILAAAAFGAACRKPKATGILGYCFVANRDSRSISVVDLSRFRTRANIALDAAPTEIVAPAKPARAYVLAPQAGTIYEVDAVSLAISRRIRLGNDAAGMRLSRAGDSLWVLMRDPAALIEVPLSSLHPQRQIRLSAPPDSFDLGRETDDACIVARAAGTVTLASLASAEITRTITPAATPSIACF